MFDIAPSELMLVAAVALVVIGPKDLPRAMRFVGQWVGRARGMARHFRMGIDEIIRQSELEEMEKKWAAENARIMAEHPMPPPEEADDAAHAFAGSEPVMTPLPAPPAPEASLEPAPPSPEGRDDEFSGHAAPLTAENMDLFGTPATPPAHPADPAKPSDTRTS
jgi:sec-independent protein translocase protein TatB